MHKKGSRFRKKLDENREIQYKVVRCCRDLMHAFDGVVDYFWDCCRNTIRLSHNTNNFFSAITQIPKKKVCVMAESKIKKIDLKS